MATIENHDARYTLCRKVLKYAREHLQLESFVVWLAISSHEIGTKRGNATMTGKIEKERTRRASSSWER